VRTKSRVYAPYRSAFVRTECKTAGRRASYAAFVKAEKRLDRIYAVSRHRRATAKRGPKRDSKGRFCK
jgi:hypothetical protein